MTSYSWTGIHRERDRPHEERVLYPCTENSNVWKQKLCSTNTKVLSLTRGFFKHYQSACLSEQWYPLFSYSPKKKKSTWYTRKSDCNSQRFTALSGKTLYRLKYYATCFTVRKTKWENFYAGIIRVKCSVCKDFHVTLDIIMSLYHTIVYQYNRVYGEVSVHMDSCCQVRWSVWILFLQLYILIIKNSR